MGRKSVRFKHHATERVNFLQNNTLLVDTITTKDLHVHILMYPLTGPDEGNVNTTPGF